MLISKLFRLLFLLVLTSALSACGGSGGGQSPTVPPSPPAASTGILFDAPIGGMGYSTPTHSGVTDADGSYDYVPNETVTFSLGNLTFGAIPATGMVSLPDLLGAASIDNAVVNLARLLQSVDTDADPDRIALPDLSGVDIATLDLTQSLNGIAADPLVLSLLSVHGNQSNPTDLVGAQTAIDHLMTYAASVGHSIPGIDTELDTDGDDLLNVSDPDDDNDGVDDANDAFPLDDQEDTDTDLDGTGNNADPDDDNDGVDDVNDAFPLDDQEDTDTDLDGTGNNADTDDDNDGVDDVNDSFPTDANEQTDADADGFGSVADCNDSNAAVYPGATEVVNQIDDDCDGQIDEGVNILFTSSVESDGDLGGLEGADGMCQQLADSSGLHDGLYRAWISSTISSASERLTGSENPYYLRDGTLLASSWSDIQAGAFAFSFSAGNGIDVDENGNKIIGTPNVWTNTFNNGALIQSNPNSVCGNWNSAEIAMTAHQGISDDGGAGNWTNGAINACNTSARLYCVRQEASAPLITKSTPEAKGLHCPLGPGDLIEKGLDNGDNGGTAGNGTLETGEVDTHYYDCTVERNYQVVQEIRMTLDTGPAQSQAITACPAGKVLAGWESQSELAELTQLCQGLPGFCYTQYKVNTARDGYVSAVDGGAMPSAFGFFDAGHEGAYLQGRYVMLRNDSPLLVEDQSSGVPICMDAPYQQTFSVGDAGPAGGVVVQVTQDGLHGLEAADTGTFARWGCWPDALPAAQGTAVGTGQANTNAILTGCTESGNAAEVVDSFGFGGYSDWYLPSKDELSLIYLQFGNSNFAPAHYLTSSEFNNALIWAQDLSDGFQFSTYDKNVSTRVPAIRGF